MKKFLLKELHIAYFVGTCVLGLMVSGSLLFLGNTMPGGSFYELPKAQAAGANDFVITIKTDNLGQGYYSSATSFMSPLIGGPYNIDWNNDGVFEDVGAFGSVIHNYGVAGVYTIRFSGNPTNIYFPGDKKKVLSVDQWGTIPWTTFQIAFNNCSNLVINATDVPNLSNVTNMRQAFSYTNISTNSAMNSWDTSHVIDMLNLFANSPFNQDISSWNVSSVTNMSGMFASTPFNQNIGNWNTGAVTDMSYMFAFNTSFNQNIGNWDIRNVSSMYLMFYRRGSLSTSNYNALLSGWSSQNVQSGVSFDAGNSKYTNITAKNILSSSKLWVITDGGFDMTGITLPSAPMLTSVTSGNATSTITWTVPVSNGGSFISGYKVYRDNSIATTTASTTLSYTDTGLTNGQTYSYYVTATNIAGESASSSVATTTPIGVPSTPSITSVTSSSGRANITFSTSTANGSDISGYTITSNPGNISVTDTVSPISITGLTNGTAYTFTVVATNGVGNSLPSTPSDSVTPRSSRRLVLPAVTEAIITTSTTTEAVTSTTTVTTTISGGSVTATTTATTTDILGGAVTTTTGATTGVDSIGTSPTYTSITPLATASISPINTTYEPVIANLYLTSYIKSGSNNDPEQVKKLQTFLNTYEGSQLIVDGVYKQVDESAVNAFQLKYKEDILDY